MLTGARGIEDLAEALEVRFLGWIQPVDATHYDPPRRKECCR